MLLWPWRLTLPMVILLTLTLRIFPRLWWPYLDRMILPWPSWSYLDHNDLNIFVMILPLQWRSCLECNYLTLHMMILLYRDDLLLPWWSYRGGYCLTPGIAILSWLWWSYLDHDDLTVTVMISPWPLKRILPWPWWAYTGREDLPLTVMNLSPMRWSYIYCDDLFFIMYFGYLL